MELKDWILLLVPILFNGIIVFALQKIFEKRQIVRTIKYEYVSELRKRIDISIELHARITRILNEGDHNKDEMINELLREYVSSNLDVYYYYIQNKVVFHKLDVQINQIAYLVQEMVECSHHKNIDIENFGRLVNEIRDVLMVVKKMCISF